MGNLIKISVRDKIAAADATLYVCGNSDFVLEFDFDAEWAAFTTKTARFVYRGAYQDVVFQGATCPVPVISNVPRFYVGVYAGDLRTTTPAVVEAKRSILCGNEAPAAPHPDVYAQLLALFEAGMDESRENANAAAASAAAAALSEHRAAGAETVAVEAAARAEELARQVGVHGGLQTDLTENDPAAPGYVHGRTHWVDFEGDVILPETKATPTQNGFTLGDGPLGLIEGNVYRVIYNGVAYDTECKRLNADSGSYLYMLGDFSSRDNPYPFYIMADTYTADGQLHTEQGLTAGNLDGADHMTVTIKRGRDVVHRLPAKFLPDDATELLLTSPAGKRFKLTVTDAGSLTVTAITE